MEYITEYLSSVDCPAAVSHAYQAIDTVALGLITREILNNEKTVPATLHEAYLEWVWKEVGMKWPFKWNGEGYKEDSVKWKVVNPDEEDSSQMGYGSCLNREWLPRTAVFMSTRATWLDWANMY